MRLRLNPWLLITMATWGFNFVAIKLLYGQMAPPAVALVRFFLMWGVLVALCKTLKVDLRYPASQNSRWHQGDAFKILFQGFLSMGIYMVLFLQGMQGSSPAEGAIMLATGPIFTLLIAILVKQERFSGGALLGAVVAFAGVALVVSAGSHQGVNKLIGNILVLSSAVVWAVSAVISRPLVARVEPLRMLTLSMPGALLALIPYGLIPSLNQAYGSFTALTWSMLAYVVFMAGVLGFICFYKGIEEVGAPGAMVYQYLVPPLAALSTWLINRQILHPLQWVGLAVVLAGVAQSNRARQRLTSSNILSEEAAP